MTAVIGVTAFVMGIIYGVCLTAWGMRRMGDSE